MTRPRPAARFRRAVALAACTALVTVACGGVVDPGPAAPGESAPTAEAPDDAFVIRLALPSEPLWQWLNDSGVLADWEAQHGVRLEASHPFRPFTAYVSGHADIILINALDVPVFSSGLDRNPVIFGKYAADRSIAAVKRTSQAADLAGVVEGRVAMESQLGPRLLWSLIADEMHALDLGDDSRDFEYVIASVGVADTVERGGAEACICLPDASAASLSAGLLRPLYDGMSASALYAEIAGEPGTPPLGQVFLTDREWYDANPAEVTAFLELWQTAIRNWNANYAEFIAAYPELLSVQSDKEIAWLTDYVARNNWVASTVHLTDAEAQMYSDAVARLKSMGHVPRDAIAPSVITVPATASGGQ